MTGDGILLKRLPQLIDPRGPREQGALVRAFVDKAWRWRDETNWKHPKRPKIPRNLLRFGKAAL